MKFLAIIKNPIFLGVTATVLVAATAGVVIYKKVQKGKKVEVVEDAKQDAAQ